jgi:hypothetical protein
MNKLAECQPLYLHSVTLTAVAVDDAVYEKNSQLSFDANNVELADGQSLAGKLELSVFGPGAIYQGDTILIGGKLYPALGAYQGRISFAKLEVIERHASWPTIRLAGLAGSVAADVHAGCRPSAGWLAAYFHPEPGILDSSNDQPLCRHTDHYRGAAG